MPRVSFLYAAATDLRFISYWKVWSLNQHMEHINIKFSICHNVVANIFLTQIYI